MTAGVGEPFDHRPMEDKVTGTPGSHWRIGITTNGHAHEFRTGMLVSRIKWNMQVFHQTA